MKDHEDSPNVKSDIKEMMTEENVVSKVQELMETLDNVKKYNALANSLKRFAIIIAGSMTVFAILRALFDFFDLRLMLDRTLFLSISLLLLLIPVTGIVAGVLFVRKKVNSIRTGEWREELSHGFPSALKILMELDWEKTIEEISLGKLSYALYGLLKIAAYWVVTFFALGLLGNAVIVFFLQRAVFFGGFFWGLPALLIVLLVSGNDLLRRYKEIHALDMLLLELRWFSFEFRRAEFET